MLETNEVDPGGEYFFDLGVFSRNTLDGSLRLGRGGRLGLELGGGYTTVTVDEQSSFYDYDTWWGRGGLGYELTPNLRATLLYGYLPHAAAAGAPGGGEPASTRSTFGLDGEILPLLTGASRSAGSDQHSPGAGAGGTDFSGLTLGADLTQAVLALDLARAHGDARDAALRVRGQRLLRLERGRRAARAGRWRSASPLSGGAGYHWNEYQTTASALGEPREDRIFGWSIGVGRPVSTLRLRARGLSP